MAGNMYANPYACLTFPARETSTFREWARTGHRRSLANYPWFVDAKGGDIVVSERDNHRLQLFDCVGSETRFEPQGGRGHGRDQFYMPGGLTSTNHPNAKIVVADTGNRRITYHQVSSDYQGYGHLEQTFEFGCQMFSRPMGLEMDSRRGFLIITDMDKRRVSLHDFRDGQVIGEFRPHPESPLRAPVDVAIDDHGRYYVSDSDDHYIHVYDTNGDFLYKFGGPGSTPGQLNKPWGICFDRDYNLIVADEGNNRVQLYRQDGGLLKVITNDVYLPKGVSVNIHENLVVTDGDPYKFLKIFKYK